MGGAETYLSQVVPALRDGGHDVFFWHEQNQPTDREPIAGLADTPSCDASDVGLESALHTLERWHPDVLYAHGLLDPEHERALLAIAPAVFFGHGYYGTCISGAKTTTFPVVQPCSRRFGPACLFHFYPRRCGGLNPVTMIADYRRQAARLENLRQYQAIATFSQHMRREYVTQGFSEDRVHVLPHINPAPIEGTVIDRPRQPASAADGDDAARTWQLTFLGRVDALKGLHVLVEALAPVRRAVKGRIVLTVAGDGPDLERCREAARAASTLPDTEIAFVGWVSQHACEALLDESDVLVMPSLWPEPFGLSGIEALRRGVPVAALASGGIPEWLEDGRTGALASVDPPTAQGLAAAIVRCLTSSEIRQTVRDRARLHAEANSIQQHLDALIPLLAAASGTAAMRKPEACRS